MTLKPSAGPTETQTLKHASAEDSETPPPPTHTGRMLVDTDPGGASVWLLVGTRFTGEGLDPRKPHRFMAHLPERGRRILTLRPYLSADNPGDWRMAPTGATVEHRGTLSFDEDP